MTETNMTEVQFLREKLVESEQKVMALKSVYARIQELVNRQADDAAIWYIRDSVLLRPEPAQVAIRALHAAIENETCHILGEGYAKAVLAPPPDQL